MGHSLQWSGVTDLGAETVVEFVVGDLVEERIEVGWTRLRDQVGSRSTYLSIDIDVRDLVFPQGTGTPETCGLSSHELLRSSQASTAHTRVRVDIVKVAPAYDQAEVTGIPAAKRAYDMLSMSARKFGC